MTTSGDGGGSGAGGAEEVERYKVDGVTYGVHRAATIFPSLTEREFDELVKDVAKNGLREPVCVRGLEIVDGRNRLRAARAPFHLDSDPDSTERLPPSEHLPGPPATDANSRRPARTTNATGSCPRRHDRSESSGVRVPALEPPAVADRGGRRGPQRPGHHRTRRGPTP